MVQYLKDYDKGLFIILVLTCVPYCFTLTVKDWGENCSNSDECFDQRMVCALDYDNVAKCLCDRFHEWNGSSVGCVQIYSISYILNKTVVVHDNVGRLQKLQELMFRGPVYSIYFMMFVIATCTLSVIVYCCYIRAKDNNLKNTVARMVAQNESSKRRSFLQTRQSTSQC